MNPGAMLERCRLSPWLTATALAAFGLGVVAGGREFVAERPTAVGHSPGTEAWGVHIALTGVALAWIVAAVRYPAVRPPMPLSADFARRVRAVHRSPLRAVPVTVLLVVCLYLVWRMGQQVLGGLDPSFTANAWGGPGYTGAFYCHYLDCLLQIAVGLVLVDRLLPGRTRVARPGASADDATVPKGAR
ncbi:hypothetical protein TSOC111612_00065 [Tsukamurella ocularis]